MPRSIAIIGGGISGLAAARRLRELDPERDVIVLEAEDRLGGVLQTIRRDDCLIESAADGFLTQPDAALQLCRRLGLESELVGTDPQRRSASVVHHGRLTPIPEGFVVMSPSRLWPMVKTPILSWQAKLRMGLEFLLPRRRSDADESLGAFVRRRFGREVLDRLVQPLLGGIYAADCEQLSLAATMPRFRQMEREHGGLLRAALRRPPESQAPPTSGARYGQFAALRDGMGSLINCLAESLPTGSIRTGAPVESVESIGESRWALTIGGSQRERLEVGGVILAVPAHRAARLTVDVDPSLAELLGAIRYNSCAVVSLIYRRSQIDDPLDGFGFVVPLIERRLILSGSFASLKYPGRAAADHVLLRIFVGGGCHAGLMRLQNDDLVHLAHREVSSLLHIHGEADLASVARHTLAMPEYHVGHLDHVTAIQERLERHPTLALAGNAYQGVGVPHCIRSGETAAERVHAALGVDAPRPALRSRETSVR